MDWLTHLTNCHGELAVLVTALSGGFSLSAAWRHVRAHWAAHKTPCPPSS